MLKILQSTIILQTPLVSNILQIFRAEVDQETPTRVELQEVTIFAAIFKRQFFLTKPANGQFSI